MYLKTFVSSFSKLKPETDLNSNSNQMYCQPTYQTRPDMHGTMMDLDLTPTMGD